MARRQKRVAAWKKNMQRKRARRARRLVLRTGQSALEAGMLRTAIIANNNRLRSRNMGLSIDDEDYLSNREWLGDMIAKKWREGYLTRADVNSLLALMREGG